MMLAVVTNYYNPSESSVKYENFKTFRNGMKGLPLFIVEATFGNQNFSIEDALHVKCQSVLWQQYRLVNHVIESLPNEYDKVVWVDADILFDDPDWYRKMDEALDHHNIIQSFSDITLLNKDTTPGEQRRSVAKVALDNAVNCNSLAECLDLSKKFASGFTWGLQRDIVEKHGIYNYWITGSDDIAFVIAIWGDWDNPFMNRMNPKMQRHYFEWAKPFHDYVNGNVGCLDGHIRHLWHGDRNYRKRWRCLREFDPYKDVVVKDGALEWCTDKPQMHKCCHNMCVGYEREYRLIL